MIETKNILGKFILLFLVILVLEVIKFKMHITSGKQILNRMLANFNILEK